MATVANDHDPRVSPEIQSKRDRKIFVGQQSSIQAPAIAKPVRLILRGRIDITVTGEREREVRIFASLQCVAVFAKRGQNVRQCGGTVDQNVTFVTTERIEAPLLRKPTHQSCVRGTRLQRRNLRRRRKVRRELINSYMYC